VSPVKYDLGFISQKTAFFIVTAVKTSKLTNYYSVGSRGVKRLRREAGHSLLTTAEVKKTWISASIPPYALMV
jgi:hypothetical protein